MREPRGHPGGLAVAADEPVYGDRGDGERLLIAVTAETHEQRLLVEQHGFAASRRREVGRLGAGDGLFLYSTKGTLASEGILFAEARAAGSVRPVHEPYKVSKREIELECDLSIEGLADRGSGVAIADLVPRLRLFAGYGQPSSWRALLQRPLVKLYDTDPEIVRGDLGPHLHTPSRELIASYASPS